MSTFPNYEPPDTSSTEITVGVAPILVLLGFTLIVARLLDPMIGLFGAIVLTVAVIHEMTIYQRVMDAYSFEYGRLHLEGRSTELMHRFVKDDANHLPTRIFIARYIAAEYKVLRDGARP
jgi:hypothetical protein